MEFLQSLSEAFGVSGHEKAVRKIVIDALQGHAENIHIDSLGSVTALKKGTDGANRPKVMLTAHMDEVGFMVTGFETDGLIRFIAVGGIDDRILPGMRVKIGDDQINGVVVWTPIHRNREQNVVKMKHLRIDVGASNKDGVGKIKRGDRIAFDAKYEEIGTHMLRGKAFDNRVGCSMVLDIVRGGDYPVDLLIAFTVQEEIGLRGALVASRRLNPDMALALEGTTANDIPNPLAEPDDDIARNPTTRVGGGAAITLLDRSMVTDPRMLTFARQTAEAHKLPYQFKSMQGGGTDAGAIHKNLGGIPSLVLSMPCRYIHSPLAMMSKHDYNNMLALAKALLNNITSDLLKR